MIADGYISYVSCLISNKIPKNKKDLNLLKSVFKAG
nr:MAG TPA: hypothetical protein [Caudoviricetes sp.]